MKWNEQQTDHTTVYTPRHDLERVIPKLHLLTIRPLIRGTPPRRNRERVSKCVVFLAAEHSREILIDFGYRRGGVSHGIVRGRIKAPDALREAARVKSIGLVRFGVVGIEAGEESVPGVEGAFRQGGCGTGCAAAGVEVAGGFARGGVDGRVILADVEGKRVGITAMG
jgi:hypothetical protein